MSTSESRADERAKDVRLSEDAISVDLVDGRTISAPPRLVPAVAARNTSAADELEDRRGWLLYSLAGT